MSVISRMLHDLESRGAEVPRRTVPTWVAESDRQALTSQGFGAAEPKGPARTRTALLLSVLLTGGAVYGLHEAVGLRHAPAFHLPSAHAGTPPVPAKTPVAAITNWRMDWSLSLGMIKPKRHQETAQSVPLPQSNIEEDVAENAVHRQIEPSQAAASSAQSAMQISIIDPPAAGRAQSSANQAVESYRRAVEMAEQGRDGVALDAALKAIQQDPQHMPARRLAIALALDQKQVDQASALIDEGLQVAPRDNELLYLHARRLALAGANEQALSVLQGLDRATGEAMGLKAGLLARTGQYAAAVPAYQQALKTRPDNATWWLGLGVALNAQGQGAMAKEAFLRARRLGQLSPDVQAWLDQQL